MVYAPVVPNHPAVSRAPFTVLIADNDHSNRMGLHAMLQQDRHTVYIAENGQEAVSLFEQHQPDIVLMDIMMPHMDGYEATRRIKALSGQRFVPVIFLTAMADEQAMVQCVECGGDDVLHKPYQRAILKAKIAALERVRQLYTTLQAQKNALASNHRHLQREYAVAEKLFSTIVHPGCLDAPHLKYLLSPMAIFNGDLLLAARKPSGGLHIMLGDFTGHGLPAAVGAMPLADIFYAMTAKGYAISDIVAEANQKLKAILPTGLFCAAALLDLDATYSQLTVWNGGLPDVLIRAPSGGPLRCLRSQHLPLGVVDNTRLDRHVDVLELMPGERVYAYTDGVIEASAPTGEMFSQPRLEAYLKQDCVPEQVFETICAGLTAFRAGSAQHDDLTLIEITCDARLANQASSEATASSVARVPACWHMALELDAMTLRTLDPLPQIMQMLIALQGLHAHRERLYTILAELFANALEHGLLDLDSGLKHTPQGFVAYYTAREQSLAALEYGWIKIGLTHKAMGAAGQLTLHIEDSGPGFDYQRCWPDLTANTTHSGRGIPLVRALCQALTYYGAGNCVEAVYVWSQGEPKVS
jgi:CheY-like chemotaxis protein